MKNVDSIVGVVKKASKQHFEGGSTRSTKDAECNLIPKAAIDAMGRRLKIGREKHGKNNWRNGGDAFREATINHLLDHIFEYMENGNLNDSNTDAIITNAAFLCHFELDSPYKGANNVAHDVSV